jgi:hypothetical protein
MPFVNSVRGTFGAQGRLNRGIQTLGTLSNPATNGVALWDAGIRASGLYYITTSTGTKQVYVDLATTDATTNKAGWMLVGSWAQASRWSIQANTVASVIDGTTPVNGFGNSFGTMPANFVRIHVSTSISDTAANSTSGDWYYYNSTATTWREWNVQDSANTVWSPPADTATNSNGTNFVRDNFKQFTSAYNLKFGYSVGQRWNGFADPSPGVSTQGDWWNGLNGTVTAIGRNGTNDGSFAILPQGSTYNTAGQDCNQNQSKFGSDDNTAVGATPNVAWFGTTATSDLNANLGFQGSDTNFWLWIK